MSSATRHDVPPVIRGANLTAKTALVVLLALALVQPDLGNVADKGALARAIGYPLAAFAVPAIWWVFWRERASFPWAADLMITLTCFTDILGNRMNLYDTIVWFDDWMHFMNTGLLTAAFILLTLHRSATLGATIERSLAFGAPAAIVWEIAEYYAFLSTSPERVSAYGDTLADLALGGLGAVVAGVLIHLAWRGGHLRRTAPQLEVTPASVATRGD